MFNSFRPTQTAAKEGNKDGKTDGPLPVSTQGLGLGNKPPLALGKEAAEDVAGSLKIHVKLALEIDIQITARIKGVCVPKDQSGWKIMLTCV